MNKSICCSVKECKFHCQSEDFCSLSKINVGTHEELATQIECTDCESFAVK